MSTIEVMLVELFDEFPRYRGIRANELMVLNNTLRPVAAQSLRIAFGRVEHQLAVNAEYAQAFQQFFLAHPELRLEANERILANSHHGEDISSSTLEELLENPNIKSQLSVNKEYAEKQAEQTERERLVKEISQGKTTYSCRNAFGVAVKYQTDELDIESIERLREISAYVQENRRLLALPKAALHEEAKVAQKAGLKEASIVPDIVLINPDTGVEFTSRELKQLDRPGFRRLLFTKSGDARPDSSAVSKSVERILRSGN